MKNRRGGQGEDSKQGEAVENRRENKTSAEIRGK